MSGLVNVFANEDTRMEIERHWDEESDTETVSISLSYHDDASKDVAMFLELADLSAVMAALEERLTSMRHTAQMKAMARFSASTHNKIAEES